MKASEFRELTDDELSQRLHEYTDNLVTLRIQQTTSAVENVRAARAVRRNVARIKTIQNERARAAEKGIQ